MSKLTMKSLLCCSRNWPTVFGHLNKMNLSWQGCDVTVSDFNTFSAGLIHAVWRKNSMLAYGFAQTSLQRCKR